MKRAISRRRWLGGQVLALHFIHQRLQALDIVDGNVEQQVFLVAVVVVEQRLGDAAGGAMSAIDAEA